VLIRKGFQYRVYPTDEQAARLDAWESALRFLWNLAHEQRLMGLARTDKRYPTAFDQINELTDLRAELPWLADVPRNVSAQLLVDLDKAWQRCFKRINRTPRWKHKGRDSLGLTESHHKVFRLDGSILRFPKLGNLRAVIHRPLEGKPKACTIRRDGDQWFASITCEVELPDPPPHPGPPVGIDRGVVNVVGLSTGELITNPRHYAAAMKRLARAQRSISRKRKGSKNQQKARAKVARIHRKVRRQREHFLHTLSFRLAKNHGLIAIEKLSLTNMTRSAAGTVEEPGKNVRAKSGLNRSILDAGLGRLAEMLKYKSTWRGGRVVETHAAYSSQECSACGHVAKENRPDQATFCCVVCGHREHADTNAGKVVLKRVLAVEPTVTVCGGDAIGRPKKQKLRVARRGTRSGSVAKAADVGAG
jgi:putative transposase